MGTHTVSEHTDMNGLWSGLYDYGGLIPTLVRFTAWFDDQDGVLTGSSLEENTFADPILEDLTAELTGARSALDVSFTKRYAPVPGVHDFPIRYSGFADSAFTEVVGEWRFDHRGDLSGHFVLHRSSSGVSAKATRARLEALKTGG